MSFFANMTKKEITLNLNITCVSFTDEVGVTVYFVLIEA